MSIGLFIFLFFTIILQYLLFQIASSDLKTTGKKIQIIGHRGAAGIRPENTIASFQKAIDLKVDYIETDVHVSKDGALIIMHDNKVDRTTNGKGEIKDLDADYIKQLDAGSWFSQEYKNEKVPDLSSLLDLIDGKTKLLLEIKWPSSGIYENVVPKIIDLIREKKAESWVVLQSFETRYLEQAHQLAPEIELQQLAFGEAKILPFYFDRKPKFGSFTPLPYCKSVNLFYLYVNKSFTEKMNNSNATVFAFTVNTKSKMIKTINLGAAGIITDYPDIAVELLRKQ